MAAQSDLNLRKSMEKGQAGEATRKFWKNRFVKGAIMND